MTGHRTPELEIQYGRSWTYSIYMLGPLGGGVNMSFHFSPGRSVAFVRSYFIDGVGLPAFECCLLIKVVRARFILERTRGWSLSEVIGSKVKLRAHVFREMSGNRIDEEEEFLKNNISLRSGRVENSPGKLECFKVKVTILSSKHSKTSFVSNARIYVVYVYIQYIYIRRHYHHNIHIYVYSCTCM